MKTRMSGLTLAITIGLSLSAFAQMQMNDHGTANRESAKAQRYKLDGVVKSVDAKERELIVDHKDIPGFMAAMTMPYHAGKDENLAKVAPGDHITADVVVVAGSDTHLENIKVTGQAGKPKGKQ